MTEKFRFSVAGPALAAVLTMTAWEPPAGPLVATWGWGLHVSEPTEDVVEVGHYHEQEQEADAENLGPLHELV